MEQTYPVLTHEIMNTIAPIVSLSQTLSLRPGTDEKVIRGLGVIREQSERLMEFTESYRRYRICRNRKRSDSH